MDKLEINEIQKVINQHFDKILNLQLSDREFRIAIRRDEIPIIIKAIIENNNLVLEFDKILFDEIINNEFKFKNEDEKSRIIINNISLIKKSKKEIKIGKELIKYKKRLPQSNFKETIKSHKQKRAINAIYDIIKLHIITKL